MKGYKLYEETIWRIHLSKIYSTQTNTEMTWILDVADNFTVAIINLHKEL